MKHLDLFSGVGGMALGLQWAGGFETVAFCEIDPFCQSKLRKNFPGIPIYDDAHELNYPGDVDVITSGDPCQRDSRANAKRDGRSLWPLTLRAVRQHRPVFVLRENVSGNIDTGTLGQVEGDLRAEGYQVRTYHISSASLGGAHNRSRTWTMAYANGAGCQERDDAAVTGAPEEWKHSMHVGPHGIYWVGSESPVLRRADDVPNRVDRIKTMGNALDPRIPMLFGRAFQATFLARNDDMSHMDEEEYRKAKYRAYQKAQPALELLAHLHGEAFRPTKEPSGGTDAK